MRKNYLLRTALSLLVLLCSFVPSWGATGEYTYDGKGTFKQITSVDEVTEGYYVLVTSGGYVASSSETTGSNRPTAKKDAVTVSEGIINAPDNSLVWKLESTGTSGLYYLMKSGGGYLIGTSSTSYGVAESISSSTDLYKYEITIRDDKSFDIKNQGDSRIFMLYNNKDFRPYSSGSNARPQLYKLDESAPSLTEATIAFDESVGIVDNALTKNLTESTYTSVATTNSDATAITYNSSKPEVAEIDSEGNVSLKKGGETTITASVAQTATYKAAEVSYLLTVVDNSDPQLAFVTEGIVDEGEYSIDLSAGTLNSAVTSVAGSTGTITYVSSVEEVAMIDETTGEIVLMGAGETIISATIVAAGDFKAQTISYTLTVTQKESFKKVTDGKIVDGRYIIVASGKDVAMNTTNKGSYFTYTAVTIANDEIQTDDATIIWTITQEADGNYSIKNENIYVGCTANKSAIIENEYTTKWDITVGTDGNATIIVSATNRKLQYNASSPRFACYESSQTGLTLYRYDDGKKETTLSFPAELGIDEDNVLTKKYNANEDTFSSAVTVALDGEVDATVPVKYSSDTEEVAVIDESTGEVLLGGVEGTTTITATVEESATYRAASIFYTLKVTLLPIPQLVFADATLTGTVERSTTDDSFDSQATVTLEGFDNVPVVYGSTVESVATISTEGWVTIHGAGETVISAEVVAVDGQYDGTTVEYTLVVSKPKVMKTFEKVTNGVVTPGEYLLVGLKDGDSKLYAMDKAMGGSVDEPYFTHTEVGAEGDDIITTDNDAVMWTIREEADGNWSISNSGIYAGYNLTATSKSNYAYSNTSYTESGESAWVIKSNDDAFDINNVYNSGRYLRFNAANPRFACYAGTQQPPMLYCRVYTVTVAPTHVNYTLNNSAGSAIAGTDDDIHETTAREGEVLSLVINSMPAAQYVKSVKWGDTELSAPHGSYTFTVDGDKTLTIETGEYCVPEDVEMSYTGSYVESVSLTSSLWEDGKFLLNMHPAETHHVYLNYTDGVMGSSFPVLVNDPVTITSVCKGESLNPGYLYVDWNKDGAFDPATEMVASAESVAALSGFTVTDEHAAGLYRARLEVDTDNTTPCALNDLDSNVAKGSVMADFDIHYFLTTPDPNDPTGVEGIEENEIQLYYHAGTIYTNAEGEIQVYDLSGKLVRRAHVAPVAVDDLAGGVYIVRVNGRTMKFVK